jgi:hypothetical protein
MDRTQLTIWFAGFYEGEGSISNDISNNNAYRLSISQNDRTPLDIGREIWGGSIRERNRTTALGKKCKGYEWVMYQANASKFIEDIKPYMIIPYKIEQMEKVVATSLTKLDRRFKCHYCELDYANPSGRRRHEKNVHVGDADASDQRG